MRDCLVVPESKPLGELLRDFQRERQQMAIVVDEYGGTSGLVTLEDVLEEIVGDIQDEHEERQAPGVGGAGPRGLPPSGTGRDRGSRPSSSASSVGEDDVDTVGGLVFSRHGTVPGGWQRRSRTTTTA